MDACKLKVRLIDARTKKSICEIVLSVIPRIGESVTVIRKRTKGENSQKVFRIVDVDYEVVESWWDVYDKRYNTLSSDVVNLYVKKILLVKEAIRHAPLP